MIQVVLKEGRERSLLRKHPWVFSGAIARVEQNPQAGETVAVFSHGGRLLGRGAYSPASQIRVRIWSFDDSEAIDASYFQRRIEACAALRNALGVKAQTNAYRLICAESDGLPGLIVDRYGGFLVCQFLSAGSERWKETVVQRLRTIAGVCGIYERSDVAVRAKEGLELSRGRLWGADPPALLEIEEQGVKFFVDIKNGHKTGFYLDQRINRDLVRAYSAGLEVLNCFAYTGGFGLAALMGGAECVTNVENGAFMELIDQNAVLNGFDPKRCTNAKADVFQLLRQYAEEGRSFDLIVLDPPKFAETQSHLLRAGRGYKDINRLALKLLRPNGLLFTFSCSGLMKMDLFQKIVADAAVDAGRKAQILHWLGQSPDHPVQLLIPESHYLKGLLLKAT